jgi:RNA polymerase sigma-70 factor, ECF subfamily
VQQQQVDTQRERDVCQRYANRIRSYGLRHLRDPSLSQDLVQQVLITVLQALREGRVEEVDNLDRYVFGTCRNTVMDMKRGSTRQQRIADATAAVMPEGYELPVALVDKGRLDQCLEHIEERGRAVVMATFIDERDAEEIARSMNLSASNVRVIRHRAMGHLRECMGGGGGGGGEPS